MEKMKRDQLGGTLLANLESARDSYRKAVLEFDQSSKMALDLEQGHPDGSAALKSATARFKKLPISTTRPSKPISHTCATIQGS
jgi:hypothetical protein